MQSVAQAWLIYRLTHSAWLLGLVGFAGQAPVFFLATAGAPWRTGVRAATCSSRRRASAMLLAFAARRAHARSGSSAVARVRPRRGARRRERVRHACAPGLRRRDGRQGRSRERASRSTRACSTGRAILGPSVAGLLVAAVGEGWCFFVNGVSFLAVIVEPAPDAPSGARAKTAVAGRPLAHAAEGFRFVSSTPPVRAILLLLGVVSVTAMPYAVLMPVFADASPPRGTEERSGSSWAPRGLGALGGALVLASRRSVAGLGRWVAIAAAAFGVLLVVFSLSRSLVPLHGPARAHRRSDDGADGERRTRSCRRWCPIDLRGRVMAVYAMVFMGMAPLGALARRSARLALRRAHRRREWRRRRDARRPGLRVAPSRSPDARPLPRRERADGRRRSPRLHDRNRGRRGLTPPRASSTSSACGSPCSRSPARSCGSKGCSPRSDAIVRLDLVLHEGEDLRLLRRRAS